MRKENRGFSSKTTKQFEWFAIRAEDASYFAKSSENGWVS